MLESAPVGIAKMHDRHIAWRHQALERMFGYADGELLGRIALPLHVDAATSEALGAVALPHMHCMYRRRHKTAARRIPVCGSMAAQNRSPACAAFLPLPACPCCSR